MKTKLNPIIDTSPLAVLGALSLLNAAREAKAIAPALALLCERGQLDAVDNAANLLEALAAIVAGDLRARSEASAEAGQFPKAARLAALARSVSEYESAVPDAHQVSQDFVQLAEDAEACAEVKSEDDLEDFVN